MSITAEKQQGSIWKVTGGLGHPVQTASEVGPDSWCRETWPKTVYRGTDPQLLAKYGEQDPLAPALYLHGEPGSATSVDLVFPVSDGWLMRLTFRPTGDGAELVEMTVRPKVGAQVPASEVMRKLGLSSSLRKAETWLRDPRIIWGWLGDDWPGPLKRPGRGGRREIEHARWAQRYVEALSHDRRAPIKWLVEQMSAAGEHVTESEVRAKVNKARPEFLTRSTERGKAGGELTPKARQVLGEKGGR